MSSPDLVCVRSCSCCAVVGGAWQSRRCSSTGDKRLRVIALALASGQAAANLDLVVLLTSALQKAWAARTSVEKGDGSRKNPTQSIDKVIEKQTSNE